MDDVRNNAALQPQRQPGTERVQALADISRSAQCCHSNETHAPIANPPNSAQLKGTPTIPPSYIRVHAECGNAARDRQTAVTICVSPHVKC